MDGRKCLISIQKVKEEKKKKQNKGCQNNDLQNNDLTIYLLILLNASKSVHSSGVFGKIKSPLKVVENL